MKVLIIFRTIVTFQFIDVNSVLKFQNLILALFTKLLLGIIVLRKMFDHDKKPFIANNKHLI